MKKHLNETAQYMKDNGWASYAGITNIYSNGRLFVMCNGTEWFASKAPNAGERWAKGWKNMLPAMKFADGKGKTK